MCAGLPCRLTCSQKATRMATAVTLKESMSNFVFAASNVRTQRYIRYRTEREITLHVRLLVVVELLINCCESLNNLFRLFLIVHAFKRVSVTRKATTKVR